MEWKQLQSELNIPETELTDSLKKLISDHNEIQHSISDANINVNQDGLSESKKKTYTNLVNTLASESNKINNEIIKQLNALRKIDKPVGVSKKVSTKKAIVKKTAKKKNPVKPITTTKGKVDKDIKPAIPITNTVTTTATTTTQEQPASNQASDIILNSEEQPNNGQANIEQPELSTDNLISGDTYTPPVENENTVEQSQQEYETSEQPIAAHEEKSKKPDRGIWFAFIGIGVLLASIGTVNLFKE